MSPTPWNPRKPHGLPTVGPGFPGSNQNDLHQQLYGRALQDGIQPQLRGFTLWWTNSLQLKMAIEIVDFPIKNGDFPLLC